MRNQKRAHDVFTVAFNNFCLRSKRFNGFVLVWEEVVPVLEGGFPAFTMQACYNNIARIPFLRTELFTPLPRDGKIRIARSLLESLENHRAKIQPKNDSGFSEKAVKASRSYSGVPPSLDT